MTTPKEYRDTAPDATVVYVPHRIRSYVRSINTFHKHPVKTQQNFDFNMNLGVYQ